MNGSASIIESHLPRNPCQNPGIYICNWRTCVGNSFSKPDLLKLCSLCLFWVSRVPAVRDQQTNNINLLLRSTEMLFYHAGEPLVSLSFPVRFAKLVDNRLRMNLNIQGNSHPWGKQLWPDDQGIGPWHRQRAGAGDNFEVGWHQPGAWLGCTWGHLVHPCRPDRGQQLCLLPLQVGRRKSFFPKNFLLSCALAPGFDQRDFKARKLSELKSGNRGWNQRRSKIWLLMILYSCSDQIWSNLILQTKNLETFGCFYSLANVLLCCLFVVTGTLYTDNKSTPAATSSFCFKVDKSKFHFFSEFQLLQCLLCVCKVVHGYVKSSYWAQSRPGQFLF